MPELPRGHASERLHFHLTARRRRLIPDDAGHANIGSGAHEQLMVDYFDDVRTQVIEAIQGTELGPVLNKDKIFSGWFMDYADAVSTKAVEGLRPRERPFSLRARARAGGPCRRCRG